jgi:hypothetical protein
MRPRAIVGPLEAPRPSSPPWKLDLRDRQEARAFRPSGTWRRELRAAAIALLEERRYADLLAILRAAREQRPSDLEILKSIRVLELHLRESDAA